jgi:hypothetical protein
LTPLEDLPFLRIDKVFHVGSLDPTDRKASRASLEGPCLSVSLHPEEWGMIARAAGPTWSLEHAGALWLRASELTDDQRLEIMEWSVEVGHARRATLWRAWFFDDEADDWHYSLHETEAEAWSEILEDDDPEESPSESGALVEAQEAIVLTEAGMARLERWRSPLDGPDGALLLYALDVVGSAREDVMGVFWEELYDPASLSCPRGGVFPDRLMRFLIADPEGRPHPVIGIDAVAREACPSF